MKVFGKTDQSFMQMALSLAARGREKTAPNPMVGAVVVHDGTVVGRGFHARYGEAHAETVALAEAGERAAGSTLYVTLEPCSHQGQTPPCADALIAAGIKRVVAAMQDPNPLVQGSGFARLREAGITVEVGCMQAEARRLNEVFVIYHELRRPFVTVKWAMSLCGRTAHDSGQSRWISNAKSREYGHRLRSRHDAVMVGIGTVLSDDPMLNVRLPGYEGKQPRKVIIDGDLAMPTRARLMREKDRGEVIIFTTPFAKAERLKFFEDEGCRVIEVRSRRRILHMGSVLGELAKLGVMSVLIEGGRQVHTSLLARGHVDKIVAFVSPKIFGGSEMRSPVEDLGIAGIEDALQLRDIQWQSFDEDLCMEGYLRDI